MIFTNQQETPNSKNNQEARLPKLTGSPLHNPLRQRQTSQPKTRRIKRPNGWNDTLAFHSPRRAEPRLRVIPQKGQGMWVSVFQGQNQSFGAFWIPVTAVRVTMAISARKLPIMPR